MATDESKEVSTIIGERFKACRIQAGLTQQEVASILGIRQVSVLGWEKGKTLPRADKLSEIAALYHTTVDYLLGKQQNETIRQKRSSTRQIVRMHNRHSDGKGETT